VVINFAKMSAVAGLVSLPSGGSVTLLLISCNSIILHGQTVLNLVGIEKCCLAYPRISYSYRAVVPNHLAADQRWSVDQVIRGRTKNIFIIRHVNQCDRT